MDNTSSMKTLQDFEESDPTLRSVLREWSIPGISGELDSRILDDYRHTVRREPLWRRFFSASVHVPLPVAVAVLMLLFVAGALTLRRPTVVKTVPSGYSDADMYHAAHSEPPVVTRTSLAGFQPVSVVNVTVSGESEK
jgi:hypothetical protein